MLKLKVRVMREKPVIVIVGPTGSGKTGVGVEIAREINGEIISADSRAIYKGMDVGTAKPSLAEQGGIRHYGFDLVRPDERFTVADFQKYAREKIKEIEQKNRTALIVGGTGLYVDAVIFDYKFTEEAKRTYTDRLEMNKKFKVFGIKWEREELKERLEKRIEKIFTQELIRETEELARRYDWNLQAMRSNIYQYAWKYRNGELSLDEAKKMAVLDDYHLAKRQMTWFKRNTEVKWLRLAEMKGAVIKCMQDEQRK